MGIDRREFLKRMAAGAAALTLGSLLDAQDKEEPEHKPTRKFADTEVWVAEGFKTPQDAVNAAVDAAGFLKTLPVKGKRVVLKPNIAFNRRPEEGACTHPDVVAATVRIFKKAGAKEVLVLDRAVANPHHTYKTSGIKEAVERAGGKLLFPDWKGELFFIERRIPNAVTLKKWTFLKEVLEADVLVNLPVAKHHGLAVLTCAVKNWLGVVGGRRGRLHLHIHQNLVDIARLIKPAFVVADCWRMLFRRGPQGRSKDDLIHPKIIVVGKNMFTVDAYVVTLFAKHSPNWRSRKPHDIGYLKLGFEQGLGETRPDKIKVHTVRPKR